MIRSEMRVCGALVLSVSTAWGKAWRREMRPLCEAQREDEGMMPGTLS